MKEIRNMVDYWQSLTEYDRASFLYSNYISQELARSKWSKLPTHIKSCLYSLWNSKIKHTLDRDIEF